MKKIREKELQRLEIFSGFTALATGILCILFLLNVLQNHWFLNFILGLGILLHVSLFLQYLIRRCRLMTVLTLFLAVLYAASLIFLNS